MPKETRAEGVADTNKSSHWPGWLATMAITPMAVALTTFPVEWILTRRQIGSPAFTAPGVAAIGALRHSAEASYKKNVAMLTMKKPTETSPAKEAAQEETNNLTEEIGKEVIENAAIDGISTQTILAKLASTTMTNSAVAFVDTAATGTSSLNRIYAIASMYPPKHKRFSPAYFQQVLKGTRVAFWPRFGKNFANASSALTLTTPCKQAVQKLFNRKEDYPLTSATLGGGLAGSIGAIVAHPLDTIAKRMTVQTDPMSLHSPRFLTILGEHNFSSLWRGLPYTIIRSSIAIATISGVSDAIAMMQTGNPVTFSNTKDKATEAPESDTSNRVETSILAAFNNP